MTRRATTLAAALLALSACRPVRPETTTLPAGWPVRPAARAERAMIASTSAAATEAGLAILRRGGNAVDAAVATGFALAVTYPEAGNLGGGGYLVVRMADGRTAALDYRETAPAAATRDMFASGTVDMAGPLAIAVPGSVAGLVAAHRRFGALPLRDVLAPAVQLADAFVVDDWFHHSVSEMQARITRLGGAAVLLPGGVPPRIGDTIRQPALARTLRAIAERGDSAFYHGALAESIVAAVRARGGILATADLASYRPEWRTPLRFTYRGHDILGMPPSSSGGVTVAETLNQLEAWDRPAPYGSVDALHRLAAAFQRAFVDRNSLLGDPAFVNAPLERLTSKAYARRLRQGTDPRRATPPADAARLVHAAREGSETTHWSVVDAQGNAVGVTTTTNSFFPGAFVPEGGFFMNNTMDDFATRPGVPNQFGLVQGEQNAVAPGKRALSAMAPTIVLDRDGRALLVVGSRGGPRIITSVVQVIVNVIDHRMGVAEAIQAPRIHFQDWPGQLVMEVAGFGSATADSLRAMGYEVVAPGAVDLEYLGIPTAVLRVPGGWTGAVDPKRGWGVAGY